METISPSFQDNDNNFNVESGIGPMTDNILNTILDRVTSGDFKEQLTNKIVSPVIDIINKKIKPYLYVGIALYLLIILLLLIIVFLVIKKKNR